MLTDTAITWGPGLDAWELREPHWTWKDAPVESVIYESLDHQPLGVCRLFPRTLVSSDVSLGVIGIGGVYVLPPFRGKGVATRLLTEVCHALAERRIIAAVLHAKDGRLYQRLGFLELQHGLWVKPLLNLDFYRLSHCFGNVPEHERPWRLEPAGHF